MQEAEGIVIHDCWKSCFGMPNVAGHGICCAHILRELESLFQFGREKWARDLAGLLGGTVHACNLADGVNTYLKVIHSADLKVHHFLQKNSGMRSSGICHREGSTIIGPHLPSPFWAVPFFWVAVAGPVTCWS